MSVQHEMHVPGDSEKVETVEVLVCYAASSHSIWYKTCVLSLGSTVADALNQSGFHDAFPQVDCEISGVGIFGQRVSLDTKLSPGDRVEIYQPLIFDPKESRRRRALHRQQQQEKRGDKSNGRKFVG